MCICMTAYNDNINVGVCEEVCRILIVFGFRVIDGAVRTRRCGSGMCGSCFPLEKSINCKVGMGEYKGQVEAFGRESE